MGAIFIASCSTTTTWTIPSPNLFNLQHPNIRNNSPLLVNSHRSNAIFGFKKWLSGDDTPLDLNVNWLTGTSFIKSSQSTNEKNFQQRAIGNGPEAGQSLVGIGEAVKEDGKTRQFGDTWEDAVSVPLPTPLRDAASQDFTMTLGSYQLTSVGNFEVRIGTGTGNAATIHIEGTVHHFLSQKIGGVKQAYDRYDFKPGQQFPPIWLSWLTTLLGLPTVKNDELNLMKECEGANDYNLQANWDRTLNVTDNWFTLIHELYAGILEFRGP